MTVEADTASAETLARELELPPAFARLLVARGFEDSETAAGFLYPRLADLSDPSNLPGMDCAVDRIWSAIDAGQRITVYGDYDADGVTGTALLGAVLGRLGAKVDTFLPLRLSDGYGLSESALRRCIEQNRPNLIVTVDCGTCSAAEVRSARASGIDVVITDHHEPTCDPAPACAVVNPKLGSFQPTTDLAGVGVAFKLCHGLVKKGLSLDGKRAAAIDLRDYLDLVAVGTVADVAPLVNENRTLVRHGLDKINAGRSVGLKALLDAAGVDGRVDCYHLGFVLGPRINAAGRMGLADPALELLMTDDAGLAAKHAATLESANNERRRVEDRINEEATGEIDGFFDPARHFGIALGGNEWHPGTIGIVASRLCARYRRPVVLVSFDVNGAGRGSCRSIEELNMVETLGACSDLLVSHGGHKAAAGLVLHRDKFEEFRARFCGLCADRLAGVDLRHVHKVDVWITMSEIDDDLDRALRRLRPFGTGNPEPVWGVRGVKVVGRPRIMTGNHLRLVVASGSVQMNAIAFRMGGRNVPDGDVDMLFRLRENVYRGRRSLELHVRDFREAEER